MIDKCEADVLASSGHPAKCQWCKSELVAAIARVNLGVMREDELPSPSAYSALDKYRQKRDQQK